MANDCPHDVEGNQCYCYDCKAWMDQIASLQATIVKFKTYKGLQGRSWSEGMVRHWEKRLNEVQAMQPHHQLGT